MTEIEPLRIGVCGVGTVGLATINILQNQSSLVAARCGREVRVTHVGARRDHPDHNYGDAKVSRDVTDVARDPEVDVVVELIGGTTVAHEVMKIAIEHGKHVVTANKALIAEHGNQLIALAEASGVQLCFEAAVAGGIPVIKSVREALAGNSVSEVAGIINGTANFILTEMSNKGRAFEEVLLEAQALGYAEADPTFDIDGTDAAHKLVILASLAFGTPLSIDAPAKQGIQALTPEDLDYAKTLGYRVKHLGIARRSGNRIEMRVHPTLIPEKKQLAGIDGVLNAIMVKADAVGELLLVGPGAGGSATASSVCADVIDIARDHGAAGYPLGIPAGDLTPLPVISWEEISSEWYLRLHVTDRPGVMSDITQTLASRGISIESLVQKASKEGDTDVPIVILTHAVPASLMNDATQAVVALDEVQSDLALIRVESFD
ncbi:homoserine dehydrogenase [Luminiphilus sp.]|nr:homoserine dehydrogenase [Luminiphilus sp.]MDC6471708.1 homoserine dehydrogenase [Luminiphilus sp.]